MANETPKLSLTRSCPLCKSSTVELVEGQSVCTECGLVISSEATREHRGNKHRKSPEELAKKADISLFFGCDEDFFRWKKLLGVTDQTERNAAFILYRITKIAKCLRLPQPALDESIAIYKDLVGKCSFKGKRLEALSAAIVYASCRVTGIPCSLRELAKVSGESLRKVFRSYSFIAKSLGISNTKISMDKSLSRLCKIAKVDAFTYTIAKNIIEAVEKMEAIAGKNPYGYIAAALYIASTLARAHIAKGTRRSHTCNGSNNTS